MRAALTAVEKTGGFSELGGTSETELKNMEDYVDMPDQSDITSAKREAIGQLSSMGVNANAETNIDLVNQVTALNLLTSGKSINYDSMLGPGGTIAPPEGKLSKEEKNAVVKEMIEENKTI